MSAPSPFGFRLAVHADWSMQASKRWMSCARLQADGWRAEAPEPVGDPASLLQRLRTRAGGEGSVALGIDCPLGLPRAYASRHLAGSQGFRDFLLHLGDRPDLIRVCATLQDVSGQRPFYPMRGLRGMSRASHAAALGLPDAASLSRTCDKATATRPAGAPVFWTLGANQSGKAAIAAWRDLILPALCDAPGQIHLWPFDGDLSAFTRAGHAAGRIMLAETYPAEALDQLTLRIPNADGGRGSKRRQADRAALSLPLRAALGARAISVSAALACALDDGFGADPAGEDRFDSLLGLTCVVSVVSGQRPDHVPDDPWVRQWEGWVLGQAPGEPLGGNGRVAPV